MDIVQSHEEEFEKVINFLKKDIRTIRTNRASIDLVANILVNVYETKKTLEELAALSIPEPRTIVIQPWDKNIVKEIGQALSLIDLGTAPQVSDDGIIRLNLPPLNEETRNNLVKILQTKLENARKSFRSVRSSVREKIVKAENAKEISEDDKYRLFENLDELTNKNQDKIALINKEKEKEIMGV
ncbi:ribosome recycling factor [Patescibacteria group bacterium]|nr:ribosome recycling factor [Patescibacteria group bacterium]